MSDGIHSDVEASPDESSDSAMRSIGEKQVGLVWGRRLTSDRSHGIDAAVPSATALIRPVEQVHEHPRSTNAIMSGML